MTDVCTQGQSTIMVSSGVIHVYCNMLVFKYAGLVPMPFVPLDQTRQIKEPVNKGLFCRDSLRLASIDDGNS